MDRIDAMSDDNDSDQKTTIRAATRYKGTDYIGKIGVEQSYETELHGLTGFEEVEVTAAGRRCRAHAGDARQQPRAVARHRAAAGGRAGVRRQARRAGRDRAEDGRRARVRVVAELRPELVRRRHRPADLGRAEQLDRQAAPEPPAARHLPARLDVQAVHGARRPDARQAHAGLGLPGSRLLHVRRHTFRNDVRSGRAGST